MRMPRISRRRIGVGVGGLFVILLGLVLIPLPGPGTLIVASGLGVLRREFPWAGRLINRLPGNIPGVHRPIKNRGPAADREG